jgi:hypothetical protein
VAGSLDEGVTSPMEALARTGLLLLSDAALPSVTGLVAGTPVRGSWWGHPKGRAMFAAASELAEHPDVTAARLVNGKVTFVHRRLWPALMGVGGAREPWQMDRLSAAARRLLDRVTREGTLRTDEAPGSKDAARELEARLLLHADQVHTERGAHARILESWAAWSRRVRMKGRPPPPAKGRALLEAALKDLGPPRGVRASLPWA